jgi:hypothetical protein
MRNNLICGTTGTRARSKRRAIEKHVFSHQLQPIAFSPSGGAPAAAVAAGTRANRRKQGAANQIYEAENQFVKFEMTGARSCSQGTLALFGMERSLPLRGVFEFSPQAA